MPRLPVIGSDNNEWGTLLNEFLEVSHTTEGAIKSEALPVLNFPSTDFTVTTITNGRQVLLLENRIKEIIGYNSLLSRITALENSLSTIPAPTTPVTDDTNNTFSWTNASGYSALSDYEFTLNGGSSYSIVTAKPLVIGDSNKAIGQVGVRVKAINGNSASATLFNIVAFVVAGGFDPLSVPGTIGWYDASNVASLAVSSPTIWNDLSIKTQHLNINSGITVETIEDRKYVKFNSNNDLRGAFEIGTNKPMSVYMVLIMDGQPYESKFLSYTPNANGIDFNDVQSVSLRNSGQPKRVGVDRNGANTTPHLVLNRRPALIELHIDNNTVTFLVDNRYSGQISSSAFLAAAGTLRLGSVQYDGNNQNFRGHMGDIIIRNVIDDNTYQTNLRNYLSAKWGIRLNVEPQDIWGVGDSIDAGHYRESWLSRFQNIQIQLDNSVVVRNLSDWGTTVINTGVNYYNTYIAPYFIAGNTLFFGWGSNDISSGYTAAQIIGQLSIIANDIHNKGGKIWVRQVFPRFDYDANKIAQKNAYNASLEDLKNNGTIDGVFYMADDARLSDYTNTLYYNADQIHHEDAGEIVKAQIANQAYNNSNVTPIAPTIIADNTANTIDATHSLGNSELLVSVDNGAYIQFNGNPISVGNVARAVGYYKFKTKAAIGRNESVVANSPIFTIAGAATLLFTENWQHTVVQGPLDGFNQWTRLEGDPLQECEIFDGQISMAHVTDGGSFTQERAVVSNIQNGKIEAEMSLGHGPDISIMFRIQNISSYYIINYQIVNDNGPLILRLYKKINTTDFTLISTMATINGINEYQRFLTTIDFQGSSIKVIVNGTEYTTTDNSILTGGKIGLRAAGASNQEKKLYAGFKVYSY